MLRIPFVSPARLLAAIMAAILAALSAFCPMPAHAQSTQPEPSKPASPAAQSAPKPNPNDELLAKAASLYYSTAKAGLNSFVCSVHPDWRAFLHSIGKGGAGADADPRIVLLNSVKISLHGQMKGGSTIDWTPDPHPEKPLDEDSTSLLNQMHTQTNQTLQGFMQFWTPFVDGSVIPPDSVGLEFTQTENEHRIHADAGETSLTEVFDNGLVLQHFDVVTGGLSVKFAPTYKPTDNGLLVDAFQAHIQPPGVPAQEMRVEIEYQTLGGKLIPAQVKMNVASTKTFNFVLDGCAVNP